MKRILKFAPLLAIALLATALAPAAQAQTKCGGKKAKIIGTDKADTLNGTPGDDVIAGEGGDDVIDGKGGNDIICGGDGKDTISGGEGNDGISGGEGNDKHLWGGPGDDLIGGGDGNRDGLDFIQAKAGVTVDLQAGTSSGDGDDLFKSIEMVRGTPFADSLTGSDENNIMSGDKGKDEIFGGAGEHDALRGGPGNDTLDGGDGRYDIVNFGDAEKGITANLNTGTATGVGTDTLSGFEGVAGSQYNDKMTGDESANIFLGFEGNDTFNGTEDTELDLVVYWYAPGPVEANLATGTATGEGKDKLIAIDGLYGGEFADTFTGNELGNALLGFNGDDTLNGMDGDDYFTGDEGGDDTIDGGSGDYDQVGYRRADAGISADFGAGTVTGDGSDSVSGVEAMNGSEFNDTMIGDLEQNYLFGKQGDDILNTGASDDFIEGGAGTDSGDGGEGTDQCFEIETPVSCEGADAAPEHPLKSGVEATQDLDKVFGKRNNM